MKHLFKIGILTIIVLSFANHCLAGTWEDDFSNINNSTWEVFNIVAWEPADDTLGAKWEIKNGSVSGSMHELFKKTMFLTGELKWQNYSVSCRAKYVGEEDKTAILGLIMHARIQENKRYMFLLNYFDQKASIVATAGPLKQTGDKFRGWSQEIHNFKIEFNTWYLLSASTMGSNILIFNIKNLEDTNNMDEFSIEVNEPITEGGLTGFLVENANAVFDDIKIEGKNIRNGGTFPIEPHSKLTTTWGKLKWLR